MRADFHKAVNLHKSIFLVQYSLQSPILGLIYKQYKKAFRQSLICKTSLTLW
jgi:hypothetical protein